MPYPIISTLTFFSLDSGILSGRGGGEGGEAWVPSPPEVSGVGGSGGGDSGGGPASGVLGSMVSSVPFLEEPPQNENM